MTIYPIIGISILTMFVANLTAVYQKRIKRMLAYSSISHAGYLLMALLAGAGAERALFIYTATYAIATIAIFAIVIFVTEQSNDFSFKAFNGFAKRQPAMALVLAFCLLSLAGIPPTPGFFGKYLMFSSVFEAHPVWVLLAIVNSAISIYYYFKIIIAMYFKTEDELSEINFARPNYYGLVVGLAMVILLAFTIFIDFWSNLIGS